MGGMAHKIRNPLFAISATIDAFEDDLNDHPAYEEYARLLRTEVGRLSALVNDLVEYGRPTPSRFAKASLGSVVEETVAACRPLATERGVRIGCAVDPRLPDLDLDRGRLARALESLIRSAVQQSPEGGNVRVRARLIEGQTGDTVECAVEDEGPGFPEADAPRLFEPFFAREEDGSGLGLSIAQLIVEKHGGRIQAASRSEGGGVVTLWLPRVRPAAMHDERSRET